MSIRSSCWGVQLDAGPLLSAGQPGHFPNFLRMFTVGEDSHSTPETTRQRDYRGADTVVGAGLDRDATAVVRSRFGARNQFP